MIYQHRRVSDQTLIDTFKPWTNAGMQYGILQPVLDAYAAQAGADDAMRRSLKVAIGVLEVEYVIDDQTTSGPSVVDPTPTVTDNNDHLVHTYLKRDANQAERDALADEEADSPKSRLMLLIINGLRDNNNRIRALESQPAQGLGAYQTELESRTEVTNTHLTAFLEGRL